MAVGLKAEGARMVLGAVWVQLWGDGRRWEPLPPVLLGLVHRALGRAAPPGKQ